MKLSILLLIAFLPFGIQQGDYSKIKSVKTGSGTLLTDHLGQFYMFDDKQITKYDQKGNRVCSYSNNQLGSISHADVSDPLRIMLFYRDFNKLVFLDKNLA